jgi:hypothetical protein
MAALFGRLAPSPINGCVDVVRKGGRLLRAEAQAKLGPAPEHVFGGQCPLMIDQVIEFGLAETVTEVAAEIGRDLRLAEE